MSLCLADVKDAERTLAKLAACELRQLARIRRNLAALSRTRRKIATTRRDHALAVAAVKAGGVK